MFFVLSKILAYLVMPIVVIAILLVSAAFVRAPRLKKKLFVAGLVLFLFFSNDFIANEVIRRWEVPVTPYEEITHDYAWAIVLTGVTKSEGETQDRVYFNRGADRVTHTVQLYKLGKVKKILVTGGSGQLTTRARREADEVTDALVLMGVQPDDIVKETDSRNTHESAAAVKKILERKCKPSDCLLITSAYHMRRSRACFSHVGWKMDGFSVDFISHKRKFDPDVLFIPKTEALFNWQIVIKEWVGYLAYKIAGYA
jgi:uncharacterized SAM-binding protein YcdF (DUF218 family)